MPTIAETFAVAVQHHQAGRLAAAEPLYLQVVQAAPDDPDALHLLGLLYAQTGRHRQAVESFRRALAARPRWAEALANLGNLLREQGQAGEAVDCLREALQLQPGHAASHNNLGNALQALGDPDEAIDCYRRAIALRPDFPEAHSNLGDALRGLGRFDEAIASYRRAVELRPNFVAAHNNLGIACVEGGRPEEAIASYRQAVALRPDFAEAHNNLGNALKARGETEAAIDCYRHALASRPDHAPAHNNLGTALAELGRIEEAIACYRLAIASRPNFAEAHNNLGIAATRLGDLSEALACYRLAIAIKPDFAEAHDNLGRALGSRGEIDEAIACHRRALTICPDLARASSNLGSALRSRGELESAIACFRRALEADPDHAPFHNNLGNALRDMGDLDGALACYRRALECDPAHTTAHSNLLCTLHYCPGITPEALAEAHAEFDRRHAAPLGPAAFDRAMIPRQAGPIRVGFVSPDLGRHPVGSFLVRLLEHIDPTRVETTCYSDRGLEDALTHRLRSASTHWRDVLGLSDERLAERIRADRIEILFDLAGHTARNRLLVFARRPAPVQVTWLGYEGTTGLGAMDVLLADDLMIPPGSERYYRERVLRMPEGYLCYDPPESAPTVGPPPCRLHGFPTFGSFNNPAKITPAVVSVWARILRAVPTARLILKYRGLTDRPVKRRFLELFAEQGVSHDRLSVRPWTSYSDYLATFGHVDLTLDPFPFSGCATTSESLWMGVPVLTLPGETFAGRHSLRILTSLGLTEMIAHDPDDYVERAAALAADPDRLEPLRSGLRERMADSPLCDGERFADRWMSLVEDLASDETNQLN